MKLLGLLLTLFIVKTQVLDDDQKIKDFWAKVIPPSFTTEDFENTIYDPLTKSVHSNWPWYILFYAPKSDSSQAFAPIWNEM